MHTLSSFPITLLYWRSDLRTFKTMTDNAASSNLMTYLFARDVIIQFMRLELVEAWDHTHSALIKALNDVNDKCFNLVQSFLSSVERLLNEDEKNDTHQIIESKQHRRAQLSLFDFALNKYLLMKSHRKLKNVNSQHSFLQQLILIYERDYRIRVLNFESKSLRWYRRLTYIDM